jgi:prefoldin subunit 5
MSSSKFGRVDSENNVFVLELGSERKVGQYPKVSADEALAFYERKFAELEAQVRTLEQRIKNAVQASNLLAQFKKLSADLVEPNAVGDLNNLRSRVAALEPKIAELSAKRTAASKEASAAALKSRLDLAEAAEAIANQDQAKTQWKQSSEKMAKLFADWQEVQKTGAKVSKADADPIWKRFSVARTKFETAKRAYFAGLDASNKAVRAAKNNIVEQAEKLASAGSNSIVEYRKLLEQWKSAGRTPGKSDDALWARFKAAGDTIYSARQASSASEAGEHAANLAAKMDLLKTYSDIDPSKGLDEAKRRLQELQKKWEKVGKIPKEKIREVEDKLRAIENKVKSAEQDHWRKSDPASIDRSNSVISQLETAIAKLEAELAKATATGNDKKIKDATDALSARRAWLETVRASAN